MNIIKNLIINLNKFILIMINSLFNGLILPSITSLTLSTSSLRVNSVLLVNHFL